MARLHLSYCSDDNTYTEEPAVPPLPVVHLNGTGRETLLREYTAALAAVEIAFDALATATCHGRDYYPQGPDAYPEARRARNHHLDNLRHLIRDLDAHVDYLQGT
jgi:hypothetical protein